MRRAVGLAAFVGASLIFSATAWADGSLPAMPYHYLHPPSALAGTNTRPGSGTATDPVVAGRTQAGFVFTTDGQAGITVATGTFAVPPSSQGVVLDVRPVDTPAGLPQEVALDGNAYAISAARQPDGKPAALARPVKVTLRWPHIPIAIYVYSSGSWKRVCFTDQATLTSNTISCPTSVLGIFTAVTTPSNAGTQLPNTPASRLNRYIPILAALAVIVVAAVLAFVVSRPDKSSNSPTTSSDRSPGSRD